MDILAHIKSLSPQLFSDLFHDSKGKYICPQIIDAGARNGAFWLESPLYAASSTLLGFEPNAEECQKLIDQATDATKGGVSIPKFREERYFPSALWSVKENRPFYITMKTGACTLMGAATGPAANRMYLPGCLKSYNELYTEIKETVPVPCLPLADIPDLGVIDLLKLDTEGAELQILLGAEQFLKNAEILFIKTEFVLVPYYQTHPVLGDIHSYLNKFGYRLLNLDLDHPTYARDNTSIPEVSDKRCHYAGDAYLSIDPDRVSLSSEKLQRLGLISLAMGFRSWGISCLKDSGRFNDAELTQLEKYCAKPDFNTNLKAIWGQLPTRIMKFIRSFKLRRR